MSVQFLKGTYFKVTSGDTSFIPNAEEIYSVVFENKSSIREVSVQKDELQVESLEFTPYPAEPVIILEIVGGLSSPGISWRFAAKASTFEADVVCADDKLLDYAIGSGRWVPLPLGFEKEAVKFMATLGLQIHKHISLAQYMQLLRISGDTYVVFDRTDNALTGEERALHLTGNVPNGFSGKLYPYQTGGYRWLSQITKDGLGGIIADEMMAAV